jgi:cyclophilin family peptidyl-prolyl cis-trans isomerase
VDGWPQLLIAPIWYGIIYNSALDPSQARWGYAVFGKVVSGMDVVDRIGAQPTGSKGPFKEDAPLEPVKIERIERVARP